MSLNIYHNNCALIAVNGVSNTTFTTYTLNMTGKQFLICHCSFPSRSAGKHYFCNMILCCMTFLIGIVTHLAISTLKFPHAFQTLMTDWEPGKVEHENSGSKPK